MIENVRNDPIKNIWHIVYTYFINIWYKNRIFYENLKNLFALLVIYQPLPVYQVAERAEKWVKMKLNMTVGTLLITWRWNRLKHNP